MEYTGRVGLPILAFVSWIFIIIYSYPVYKKLDYIYMACALGYIVFGWFLGKSYDIAKFYSEKDYLTQAYTRRYALNALSSLLPRMAHKRMELSLFVVDVDKFKDINDTYGHDMGDTVLKSIAALLKICTRKADFVTRWGGDEFLIIAPYTNNNNSIMIIHRIENQLRELSNKLHIDISLSVGVSVYPDDALNIDELISIADKKMYMMKLEKSHQQSLDVANSARN